MPSSLYADDRFETCERIDKRPYTIHNKSLLLTAILWGLAHGGAEGVRQVIEMIVNELCYDMRSVGAQCLDDLGPHLIVKAPTA